MENVLSKTRGFLNRYMVFPAQDHAIVTALYCAVTHLWQHFDALPYLHITSVTKRSGKSRLAELMQFVCNNPVSAAGAGGAASLYRSVEDEQPTIFMDEIERLSSETGSVMREMLNVGYRRGGVMRRWSAQGAEEFPAFCPKVFIGIGDLYDTLRDRTIAVKLVRGKPPMRFLYEVAKTDGAALRDEMHRVVQENKVAILDSYARIDLSFLSDRDEELWLPVFAVCSVIETEMVEELKRIAVDMATEKTTPARRHVELEESEEQAATNEYGERLLIDLHALMLQSKKPYVLSADAIDALKAIPTAPWRKFRGDGGLDPIDMSNLLARFTNVKPVNIKVSRGVVRRGYRKDDVAKALATLNPDTAPTK